MTISTRDQLLNAMAAAAVVLQIDKATIANAVAQQIFSTWRATGLPAQPAIPTAAAIPVDSDTGSLVTFTNPTSPALSYLPLITLQSSLGAMGFEIHDRVAHYGGLVLNVTTAQTLTGMDIATLGLSAARRGASNYSDLQWWIECYSDGGATASAATINVTYNDASTGNLPSTPALGGTLRAGRLIPLHSLVTNGKWIKGINSVTLSASTGTAGNFGITVTRPLAATPILVANTPYTFDWPQLGFPNVPDDAHLMQLVQTSTTSTGTLRGLGKLVQG
jgi:hypothetical protein